MPLIFYNYIFLYIIYKKTRLTLSLVWSLVTDHLHNCLGVDDAAAANPGAELPRASG